VLCDLADGTTAFDDELPADARVIRRRTVTTRGRQLGWYKVDGFALRAVLAATMPEEFGKTGRRKSITRLSHSDAFSGT
jgi:hypothetical protein